MYLLKFKKQQLGFSIVELLIAMTLGLVLSAGAVQIFVNNGSVYRMENELSRMQENGRFVVNNMIEDLRMVGYNGCSSRIQAPTVSIANATIPVVNGNPATSSPPTMFDGTESLSGFEAMGGNWSPNVSPNLNIVGALPGTDVLNIQRVASCGAQVTAITAATDDLIVAPNSCDFDTNQVVMVTDCRSADVFQISGFADNGVDQTIQHQGGVNSNAGILASNSPYDSDALVYRFISNAYYIANDADGQPALFRSTWIPDVDNDVDSDDFDERVLAHGVQDMQLLYGEDTGGDSSADQYRTADTVVDWNDVRSVRISLLLQSDNNNITQGPRGITFNGALVNDPNAAGADKRLRTVYTTTVSIRNRLP